MCLSKTYNRLVKDSIQPSEIADLLARLGELLEAHGPPVAIVVVGGAALNLLGVIQRSTVDIDVIAIGRDVTSTSPGRIVEPQGLPPELAADVARLTRDFDLPPAWINTTVAMQWRTGLPPGFEGRIGWRHLGGLWLGLADRQDLVALKLHAAADNDRRSRHLADLIALRPTAEELKAAVEWVEGQDAGPAFRGILQEVVAHVATHTR